MVQGYSKARIYGLEELNGTAVMYVLKDDPEKYGLPAEPKYRFPLTFGMPFFAPANLCCCFNWVVNLGKQTRNKKVLPGEKEAQ